VERASNPITFIVERTQEDSESGTSTRELEITVPPQRLKVTGIAMQLGPVEAIREGSPAEAAGIKVGDILLSVNDRPIGDPLSLPIRFREWTDQEVTLKVERKENGESKSIDVVVRPDGRQRKSAYYSAGSLVGVESIGIAVSVRNRIASVKKGSPADLAGLTADDVVVKAELVTKDEAALLAAKEVFGKRLLKEGVELSETHENWPYISFLIQSMPPGLQLQLTYKRGSQELKALLTPVDSDEWFYDERGLILTRFQRIHTAASWGEAWALGYRETKESLVRVLTFLGKLVTFQISPKSLGGPLMIAAVANSEANEGIPNLLLFLTLLSANLAILNFLPIPALDGGHIVFLIAEAVTGKPVDERVQGTLTMIGVACLLALMLFVFGNDIKRIFL
jgi:regulator of sigma E protease